MNRTYIYPLLALLLTAAVSSGQGIKIMPGTTFRLTGGSYNLVLHNGAHLENNAALQSNSLVVKATGTGNSDIKGTGALGIASMQVNKDPGQSIVLQKNMDIAQGIYFTSGLVDLNGFDIILADTAALVNESGASRITGAGGAVQITRDMDAPLAENPGNLGLVITSGANWGTTQIRRSPESQTNPGGGGNSVTRSFQVTPANNTGLNAFLRMYYLDAEVNGLDESTMDFFRSDDGVQWSNIGAAGRNTTQNFVNINGVQTMALFTLSAAGNPLPVTFSNIRISCIANRVQLQWQYDDPLPGAYFRVDKSRDGVTWHNIAEHVNIESSPAYRYSYTDISEPYPYYRLQYITPDGKVAYSPVEEVNCRESGYAFSLMQNPVGNRVRIWIQARDAGLMTLRIYDMQGRQMLEQPEQIVPGISYLNIDVSGIAAGMYMIQAGNTAGILWQTKFVK